MCCGEKKGSGVITYNVKSSRHGLEESSSKATSVKSIERYSPRSTGHERSVPFRTRQRRILSQPHDTILKQASWKSLTQYGVGIWQKQNILKMRSYLQQEWINIKLKTKIEQDRYLVSSKKATFMVLMSTSVWALAKMVASPPFLTFTVFHTTTIW